MARKPKHTTEETKTAIADAFVELFAGGRSERITVNAIIEKAHVTRSTFYYHYKDVYDLMDKIENDLFDNYVTSVLPFAMESIIKNDYTTYASFIDSAFDARKNQLRLFMITNADPGFTIKLKRFARSTLLGFMGETETSLSPEQAFALEYIVNAMFGMVTWYLSNDKPMPISEVIRIAYMVNSQGPLSVLAPNIIGK